MGHMVLGVDLCSTYGIVPEDFVENYYPFSFNNFGQLMVTESTLDDYERKVLTKWDSSADDARNVAGQTPVRANFNYDDMESDGENDEVMSAYICTTPKV